MIYKTSITTTMMMMTMMMKMRMSRNSNYFSSNLRAFTKMQFQPMKLQISISMRKTTKIMRGMISKRIYFNILKGLPLTIMTICSQRLTKLFKTLLYKQMKYPVLNRGVSWLLVKEKPYISNSSLKVLQLLNLSSNN